MSHATVTIPVIGTPVPRARARAALMPVDKFDSLLAKFTAMCASGATSAFRAVLKSPGQFFRVSIHKADTKAEKAWERAVRKAAQAKVPQLKAAGLLDDSGIAFKDEHFIITIVLIVGRPQNHYGTGKNAGIIKPRCMYAPVTNGKDNDNGEKLIWDVLHQASLTPDDSHIQGNHTSKKYTENGTTGAIIKIKRWEPSDTYDIKEK